MEKPSESNFQNLWSKKTKFVDRWVIVWILLAFILLFTVVNQFYLSIGSETFKNRKAYEWTQLVFLVLIPILSGILIYHQTSFQIANGFNNSSGMSIILGNGKSLGLVSVLVIATIGLQCYVMFSEPKYHRRRMLDALLFIMVFLLCGATMMAVQPVM